MSQEAEVPSENVRKTIEEIQRLIKEAFDNPNAFVMVALCTAGDNTRSACKVRFLSHGKINPQAAYIGAMLACHELAKKEMEWPEGEGPMAMFNKSVGQNPPWGKG